MTDINITIDPDGTGDYVSINAADLDTFGATSADFVTNQEAVYITCICTGGTADTAPVDTDGYTTNSTYTVKTITVDPSYRHSGKYPTSGNVYRHEASGTIPFWVRTLTDTVITGLAVKPTGTGSNIFAVHCHSSMVIFESCVVDMSNTGTGGRGITVTAQGSAIARNCKVGNVSSAGYAFNQYADYAFTLYNCLAYNSAGGYHSNGSGYMSLQNCVAWDCPLPFYGTFYDTDYNADNTYGTAPIGGGLNHIDLTGYTAAQVYTNESTEDFSLVNTSSPLYDAGLDLTASGVVVDILGDSRKAGLPFDVGPHKLDIVISNMVLGGNAMNLTTMQTEVKRIIGRQDSSLDGNITQALNRALREWATEFPWEGMTEVGEITHQGGSILTFPRHVARVAWVADKTNTRAVPHGSRQWDREAPYTYLTNKTGYALQWEPAGLSPIWTNITNTLSLISTWNGDNRNVCVTGRAYYEGGSGSPLKTIQTSQLVGLSGETGVTLSNYNFISLDMVSADAYQTSPAAEIHVVCEGDVVGVVGPYDLSPQHQRIRFIEVPAADTVFRYGAYLEPMPIVESYQSAPPNVDVDYLTWFAASEILWQTKEGERSAYARKMADRVADTRRERERMFGDGCGRIIPEDLT